MSLATFIGECVLKPRLKGGLSCRLRSSQTLPGCGGRLGRRHIIVVDASESGIESREKARDFVSLASLAATESTELVIYIPTRPPKSDHERVMDPYAAYTAAGGIFPDGDGDEYLSLCLKAKPDHASEIRRLFQDDPHPAFELVDNIGGGVGYPTFGRSLRLMNSA